MPRRNLKSKKISKLRTRRSLKGGRRASKKKSSKKGKSVSASASCPNGMNKLKTKSGMLCVGKCPHSGGPIYYNPSTDKLVCKWHGSQFKTSGKVLTPPAYTNLKVKKL